MTDTSVQVASNDTVRMAEYAMRLERVRRKAIYHINALLDEPPDPHARAAARAFLEEQEQGDYE